MADSYLDEGFLLDKKIGVNQPKKMENVKILVANTSMDADKIKVTLVSVLNCLLNVCKTVTGGANQLV